MSLYRSLVDAALDACLTRNEYRVFLALMNQTIGYGKTFNHLTDKRLVNITKIRLDRLYPAIEGVVNKGLFEVEASRYYDYRYQIASDFLKKHPTFFTPHILKKEIKPREKEIPSVIQKTLPKNGDIYNITSTSFNLTLLNPQHTPFATPAETTPPIHIVKPIEIPVVVEAMKKSHPVEEKKAVNETVQADPVDTQKTDNPSKWIAIALPNIIPQKNVAACIKALHPLSITRQKRVISAYKTAEEQTVIRTPVGFLIDLAKKEKAGCLTLHSTPPAQTHASHRYFDDPKPVSKTKDDKVLEDHFGKLDWLKNMAASGNEPLPVLADKMGMSCYLENTHFLHHWLTVHAQHTKQSLHALAETLGFSDRFIQRIVC